MWEKSAHAKNKIRIVPQQVIIVKTVVQKTKLHFFIQNYLLNPERLGQMIGSLNSFYSFVFLVP